MPPSPCLPDVGKRCPRPPTNRSKEQKSRPRGQDTGCTSRGGTCAPQGGPCYPLNFLKLPGLRFALPLSCLIPLLRLSGLTTPLASFTSHPGPASPSLQQPHSLSPAVQTTRTQSTRQWRCLGGPTGLGGCRSGIRHPLQSHRRPPAWAPLLLVSSSLQRLLTPNWSLTERCVLRGAHSRKNGEGGSTERRVKKETKRGRGMCQGGEQYGQSCRSR